MSYNAEYNPTTKNKTSKREIRYCINCPFPKCVECFARYSFKDAVKRIKREEKRNVKRNKDNKENNK